MKSSSLITTCWNRVLAARRLPATDHGTYCSSHNGLDGIRPSRDVVSRLRQGLAAAARAVGDLRAARCEVREAVSAARAEGAGYHQIAAAIVTPRGDLHATTQARTLRFCARAHPRMNSIFVSVQ